MRKTALTALFVLGFAVPGYAATQQDVDRLFQAMRVEDVVDIMRQEGMNYAGTLAEEMLPDGATKRWEAAVGRIYDTESMRKGLESRFAESVADEDLSEVIDFFESDLGKRVVDLEISAREALLDPAIEDASRDNFERMVENADERLEQVGEYIDANDLVEANVAGALNSNFAFLQGLADGGARGAEMSEEEMLATIWQQEEDVRTETRVWLYSYLLMAYAPLDESDLDKYIEMSRSQAGRAMNRALFDGFDPMFTAISSALGQEIARIGSDQEL
ncbi:DUF2059 domain-containing protein [Donghicola sp. C2-DW-16]|uniref:DUF2059 domain-containing protein n=1 Tax=Donghicola mangrovi TaxID=2729614 RepID=A0ABX2PEV9_9RHOB|nr:DUF2059 domain-containing protein [Donghicola mangrovi]NVO27584.1 DUF2059 domain-containing protein [Donghicola mangrovi]